MLRKFSISVPEYFNFGFDVIDSWAKKDRNKLAMIWVNQAGEEKKYRLWTLQTSRTRQQISCSNMVSTKEIASL